MATAPRVSARGEESVEDVHDRQPFAEREVVTHTASRRNFVASVMSMTPAECPTCRIAMEQGFLIDRAHLNVPSRSEWSEGQPEITWWRGLKLKGHERIATVTFRCSRCGLLQSYAPSA